jgi:integrase
MSKRRGKGEGSITQLPDGRWQARIDLGYVNGKRKRKSIYGKTREEVAKKLTRALADHQRGLPLPDERLTVEQFLHRWLEEVACPSVRPRTYASYAQLVRLHLVPGLGRTRLARLRPEDVQAFLNRKLQEGLSPRTVQYLHAVLRRALGQAEKWGLVARNVARLVDPPKVARPEVRPLTAEEARRLLDATRGDRLEALYSVAVAVGLRQGEALGLRWQDVDLDRGLLTVRVQLQRIGGTLQLVEPKSPRSQRTIQLPTVVVQALREHRARQLAERLQAGAAWQEHGLVFTTSIGTPLDARNVVRHFHRLLAKAGLPRMPFHVLRHTAASLLLAQGLDLRVVQQVLGHSQIALTANLYAHVMPVLLREAAERMDALLR